MMDVIHGLPGSRVTDGRSAVTIGAFAIVHTGHVAMLKSLVATAENRGLIPTVVTFARHPLHTLAPERAGCEVATIGQRLASFEDQGVQRVLLIDFDSDVAAMSPAEFVQSALVDCLDAAHAIVGEDFRFGHNRAGNAAMLSELGAAQGFTVDVQPLITLPDGNKISTSEVRASLAKGDVSRAAELLGRPFCLAGRIVEGDRQGRELGFPTANLLSEVGSCVPARGIYSGWLVIDGAYRPGVVYVGEKASVSGPRVGAEIHVFDLDSDLYGLDAQIAFHQRIREDRHFDSVSELVAQIGADAGVARELLNVGPADL